MEQYPQEISSLYAAVSDVETELIALQAKLLATRCNHELQGSLIATQPCYSCNDAMYSEKNLLIAIVDFVLINL